MVGESKPLLQIDVAAALGVSPQTISRLVQKGMPITSIADAKAWQEKQLLGRILDSVVGVGDCPPKRCRRRFRCATAGHLKTCPERNANNQHCRCTGVAGEARA